MLQREKRTRKMYNATKTAEILQVTRQTVYRYMKKYPEYVQVINGVKYMTEEGIQALKENDPNAEEETETQKAQEEPISQENNENDIIIKGLMEQLESKDSQLKEKDKQIERLHDIISAQNERHRELNIILAQYIKEAQTNAINASQEAEEPKEKVTLYQRIKNIFKKD